MVGKIIPLVVRRPLLAGLLGVYWYVGGGERILGEVKVIVRCSSGCHVPTLHLAEHESLLEAGRLRILALKTRPGWTPFYTALPTV